MSETERTTPAPVRATVRQISFNDITIDDAPTADPSDYRIVRVRRDVDISAPGYMADFVRGADGLVVVVLISNEKIDEVRFQAQYRASDVETLLQAQAALAVAIEAIQGVTGLSA